jgi:DNA-binding SARP family transcriptional activator
VPSMVLVWVGRRGLEVVLEPKPSGRLGWFSPCEGSTGLVLDADIGLDDLKALAEGRWPVWPVLVGVGERDGSTLLLNLEYAGSLSVEGPGASVAGILAGFALQLASQPWCDEMVAGLYTTGDSPVPDLPAALHHVGTATTLDLAEKLDLIGSAQQELAGEVPLSTLRAVACEALPNVAVAFAGTPAATLQCLAEAAVPERSGVVVVGAGPFTGANWRLVLDVNGQALLQGRVGPGVVCYEVTVDYDPREAALLSEALEATTDRLGVPAEAGSGGHRPVGPDEVMAHYDDGLGHRDAVVGEHEEVIDVTPPADRPRAAAPGEFSGTGPEAPQRGEVEICVLGPVDIVGGDLSAIESSRRMAVLGVLAYMASHRRAVSADELASNLWPLDVSRDDLGGPQRKTVMNVISRARSVLGYGLSGKDRLFYSAMGYRLADEVTCDLDRFERLVANARRQSGTAAVGSLHQALELVRGEPFGGALASQFFEWVASEHLDLTLSAKVVDVAQDLGEIALEANDLETVSWAVGKGLQLEPTREELFRLWMHALGRAGRPARVDEVYRRLKLVLRQRLHPLHEPQTESRDVWRAYTAAKVTSAQG